LNILITAGTTREPIDAVRFISNYSTGSFGYEIAREAKRRGHRVILISGPTGLAKPSGISSVDIETPRQLENELKTNFEWCDCLIMTAAVCDFRVVAVAKGKIKRGRKKKICLALKQNPDILRNLGRRKQSQKKLLIGFALESENLIKNALRKLREKNLDLIVATKMSKRHYPFGQASIKALIIDRKAHIQRTAKVTKKYLSRILLDRIEKLGIEAKNN
jgi:phosphopantothenoylcysteine decarboxylase/phosphopantothenate--cysteine ligase